ncbi:hypothetical protein F1188_19345 [Roseospira marina]|uniref:Uncharacterized protein n=1 Tax=Roseospira marina TaxID=140057 RepID=A0A5M6I6M5_9PROT|nr:hypothetical protein [Roseospira marina]KAA5603753.1 hypothetical protein F1188_19345 [Roseospira marina]MBB4316057.1 hypothetical protein [Roseospira marina]MBB5089225.1 hypothetical protein [Roseospira marina]
MAKKMDRAIGRLVVAALKPPPRSRARRSIPPAKPPTTPEAMIGSDDGYLAAMRRGWQAPVRQLGMIDVSAAPWLVDAVIKGYRQGFKNTQIATALRTAGGVMSKEEKAERGLVPTARLGTAFFDALTAKGRADPVLASRAIVSRVTRAAVWTRDRDQYLRISEQGDRKRWITVLHRGPRCCTWAYNNDKKGFDLPPELPIPSCDKEFCSCRAVLTPVPGPDHGQIALGIAVVAGVATILIVALT